MQLRATILYSYFILQYFIPSCTHMVMFLVDYCMHACVHTYTYESPVAQVKPYKYENLMYSLAV